MSSTASNAPTSPDSVDDGQTKHGGFSRTDWAFVILLIAGTVIAYLPAMRGAFLWDDRDWIAKAVELGDWKGLWKMWSTTTALQQYYPLAGTWFWLDHRFWGSWTTPYHVENVLGHALSALLFWRLLEKLEVRGAKLAAAIFAVHPVMVESAGWITERKNVLSMVFFLGSLLAYGRYCGFWKGDDERSPKVRGAYGVALALFVAGLLAKITAFVFPPTVLLLCWWKRGRIRLKQDVLPTLPFFVLALGLGYFISWLEKHHVGAGAELTLPERLMVAGHVPWFYAAKLLWPVDVCFMYPRWILDVHSKMSWLVVAVSVLTPVALWVFRDRLGRGLIVAGLFFVGCLFPVLGLFDVYGMHFTFVADRWMYFSSLGLIAVVASGLTWALRSSGPWARCTGAAVLLGPLMMLTWRHSALLKDAETLWTATVRQSPDSWGPWNELGAVQLEQMRLPEALASFQKSIASDPRLPEAQINLADVVLRMGDLDAAIRENRKAVSVLRPSTGLAVAGAAYFNLAGTLQAKGMVDEAIVNYQKAVAVNDESVTAHVMLGHALFRRGRLDEALVQYRRVLELHPGRGNDFGCIANVLTQQGHAAEAATYYDSALKVDPVDQVALNNYSRLLASSPDKAVHDGAKAIVLAERLNEVSKGKNPNALATLAHAYAEGGRFTDAVASIKQAQELATAQGNHELLASLEGQRKLLEAR